MGSVKSKKVDTYVERLYCDLCDEEMVWNRMELTSNPAQYPHSCPKCGATQNVIGRRYPRTVHRETDDSFFEEI